MFSQRIHKDKTLKQAEAELGQSIIRLISAEAEAKALLCLAELGKTLYFIGCYGILVSNCLA